MTANADYRDTHRERGGIYDKTLADTPFDAYMAEFEGRHLNRLIPKLIAGTPGRHLDFACGTGRITSAVAPLCGQTIGVDISQSMIEVARAKVPTAVFHLGDITRTKLELGTFDLITAFRFFGNAQPELREEVMGALASLLKPAGYLVINNHRNPRSIATILDRLTGGRDNRMDLHLPKLRSLLSRHGFAIRQIVPIATWMFRSRMMSQCNASDPTSTEREARYSVRPLASISPDMIVVAQKA